jgi:hypothetical protein
MWLSLLLTFWIIIANVFYTRHNLLLAFIFIIIGVCVVFTVRSKNYGLFKLFFNRARFSPKFLPIIILLSLAARFSFVLIEYTPTADPAAYYDAAKNFANSGNFGGLTYYLAIFPYLFSYSLLLGMAFKVLGVSVFTLVLLNTILDFCAAGLLYLIVKNFSETASRYAFVLWIISPFNIIFSAISLPLIAVNCFILLSIYIVQLLVNTTQIRRVIILSICAGLVFGFTNSFRPIMPVIIIAAAIYMLIISRNDLRRSVIALIFLITTYTIFNICNFSFNGFLVSLDPNSEGIQISKNSGGWSFYVGSNYENSGTWNPVDATYFYGTVMPESDTFDQAQERIFQDGVDRYKSYSPVKLGILAVKKSFILTGNSHNSIYNLSDYNFEFKGLSVVCAAYTYLLILLNLTFWYGTIKRKQNDDFINFLALCMIGLFLAFLFVEVANRYITPFFVFFVIISSLNFCKTRRD